jgi:hypothetical protein
MRKDTSSARAGEGRGQTVPDFAAFGGFAPPNVEAAFRAGNAWMKGIGTLNEEMISFSQEQLSKCVEAGQSLLKCSSFEQAISIQSDLAKSALDSYYREANKLISMTSDIAREAMAQEPSAAPAAAAAGED